jgi:2-polyprenyl-3-methyl-5-hydroxy-6-metoxy-1,4-benzoquinol methylase
MRRGLDTWHWQCPACGYEATQFDLSINEASSHALIDEIGREKALKSLRDCNFHKVLQLIFRHLPQGRRKLLDVGAAHGWFVKMASEHMEALGIEPDRAICQKAREQGIPLIEGYFPTVLADDDRFDVIVFNDVFEHMPNVENTLSACVRHLTEGGLLVLNLPSSDGFFYRHSKLLKRMGSGSAFERMWQKGLPSPHLHYFNSKNLVGLAEKNGFERVCVASLPSIHFNGLYNRISYVNGRGKLRNILAFIAVASIIPFMGFLKSDIIVVILRKTTAPPRF